MRIAAGDQANNGGFEDFSIEQAASQLGYPRIKPRQLEAVVKFVQGRDVLVSLPTSYGKTLMPSLHNTISDHQSSIDIVLSPLVALIAEQ